MRKSTLMAKFELRTIIFWKINSYKEYFFLPRLENFLSCPLELSLVVNFTFWTVRKKLSKIPSKPKRHVNFQNDLFQSHNSRDHNKIFNLIVIFDSNACELFK